MINENEIIGTWDVKAVSDEPHITPYMFHYEFNEDKTYKFTTDFLLIEIEGIWMYSSESGLLEMENKDGTIREKYKIESLNQDEMLWSQDEVEGNNVITTLIRKKEK